MKRPSVLLIPRQVQTRAYQAAVPQRSDRHSLTGTRRNCAMLGMAAALLATTPALAQVQLKISGRVGFAGGVILDTNRDGGTDRDYDFQTRARLQFDVKNVTASGLEYG